jgi:D-cysteine desulfhydrase
MKKPKSLHLANLPTPIQKVSFDKKTFLIKRDDFTGFEFSGNKIRKLNYLLADALEKKAKYVLTVGGEQSNHVRATVSAAASLGMKTIAYLWGKDRKPSQGNLLLDKIFGAELRFLSLKDFLKSKEILEQTKIELKKKRIASYIIPEGGSNSLGIWGYVEFWNELSNQIKLTNLDGVICASGSGGTAAGLLIGATLYNIKTKIYAVNVLYNPEVLLDRIFAVVDDFTNNYQPKLKVDFSKLTILDGFSDEGYKNIEAEKSNFIKKFANETGILLDPTYTGKAFFGFYQSLLKNNSKKNYLFIHTGGQFALFSKSQKFS